MTAPINNIRKIRVRNSWLLAILCLFSLQAQAQQYSLADTDKVRQALGQDFIGIAQSNPNKALDIAKNSLNISRKINYPFGIIKAYQSIGFALTQLGRTAEALENYNEALKLCKEYNLPLNEASILSTLGALYYFNLGDPDKAFESFSTSLKICQSFNNKTGMEKEYASIAFMLYSEKRYEESNKYNLETLALSRELKDTPMEASTLGSIGVNFMGLHNYPEAYKYLMQSFKMKKDFSSYGNLGYYYHELNKLDSALYYLNIGRDLLLRDSDMQNYSTTLLDIGSVLVDKGNDKLAEQQYKQSLIIAEGIADLNLIYRANKELSRIYARQKDYRNAYKYDSISSTYRDSIQNTEKLKKLQELTVKFEVKELENKNASLNKENELQKLKLQRKNVFIYGSVSFFIVLFALALLLVRQGKLKASQQKLEMEQKQLRAQMNPHFIFNCLNSIQHFIVMNDVKNANKYLTGFASLMRQTLENSKEGTISLRREIEYLEEYIGLEQMRFENRFSHAITCSANIDKDNVEIPSMIIQPFIENAIRHGLCYLKGKEGKLTLSFYMKDSFLFCEVDDNGIGREQSQKIKISSENAYESQGMELTKQRLALVSKSNNSDYSVEIRDKKNAQNEPEGTTIIIKFSLDT